LYSVVNRCFCGGGVKREDLKISIIEITLERKIFKRGGVS
jgi:hypothetical protein